MGVPELTVKMKRKGVAGMLDSVIPKLLAKSDLATRWKVSRQVVNNWSRRYEDFPPEAMRVDNGRVPLCLEEDIAAFERKRCIASQGEARLQKPGPAIACLE